MPSAPQAGTIAVVAVGAVVVDRAARVLLVRRARAPGAGTWTLPGGRVEQGESFEVAIVRELREETALATRVVCALGVVPIVREGLAYAIHEHLLVPLDHGEGGSRLVAGDDAADARWVGREEVDALGVEAEVVALIDRGLTEARRLALASPLSR
jgi:acetyl-CoA carboxylase carboxyl transferase subunit beta